MKSESCVVFDAVTFRYPETDGPVFSELNLELPPGVISFVGQNGTGKSTALLLASGRLLPESGSVRLFDTTTEKLTDEEERNGYASFIYQNMEFETEDSVAELFDFVYEHGFHESKSDDFVRTLVSVFELEKSIGRKLQALSKGEIQRAIIVFSLLYGSKIIMMDEPIFALEAYQKERALEFITDYSHRTETPVYYSLHELDLSRKYADHGLLFYKDGRAPLLAPSEEAFGQERVEAAYEYPAALLHRREYLFRENLLRSTEPGDRAPV